MGFEHYWYIVAQSEELGHDRPLARRVLDERLVCFRHADGTPVVLRDRCLHRNAPLSGGTVRRGLLTCPYHGWTYDAAGRVVDIPAMRDGAAAGHCLPPYAVRETDGYIYVRLDRSTPAGGEPFRMPHYGERGWINLRLQNRFRNTVSNCVENFIDIPHTAFVHRALFRTTQGEKLHATVTRANGSVHVAYRNESANLGSYRWFLNPRGEPIQHTDTFHAPNITCVTYCLGARTFIITSQSVPLGAADTLVYTDLTYSFGLLNRIAAPFVRRHGQRIIDQDIEILGRQMDNIEHYGSEFRDTPVDAIHRMVDSIRAAIERGEDPRTLAAMTCEIEFFV